MSCVLTPVTAINRRRSSSSVETVVRSRIGPGDFKMNKTYYIVQKIMIYNGVLKMYSRTYVLSIIFFLLLSFGILVGTSYRIDAFVNADVADQSDFDGDGEVGFSDFVLFAGVFGSNLGDEEYDSGYDLNSDGAIGFADFVIFAQNFGKEIPQIVMIPDPNLRSAIESRLGKVSGAAITRKEISSLTVLDLRDKGILDLEGLQFATNLVSLSLGRGKAEWEYSISPGITAPVEYLLVDKVNEITDLSPLSNLTRLNNLNLHRTGVSDISPLVLNKGLGHDDRIDITGNHLDSASISIHIPALQSKGVNVLFDEVVVSVNDAPLIYNDNVFVLPVAENLVTDQLQLINYTTRFYQNFEDVFDFLMIWSNLYSQEDKVRSNYAGIFIPIKNDIRGIGMSIFSENSGWGSEGALQGIIHMPNFFAHGVVAHEVMHRWANFVLPSSFGSHWGFSSTNGVLGGFDINDLVDLGNGQYSADLFWPSGGSRNIYAPIELYLAGFISPENVPDIMVAVDGQWLVDDQGNVVNDAEGNRIFTTDGFKTISIEDIIAEHGSRVPDYTKSQKHFRAAAILLIDKKHPATMEVLETISNNVSWFSYAGDDHFDQHNFYESTGQRGTISMDGLAKYQRRAGLKKVGPPSFGTSPLTVVDYWE